MIKRSESTSTGAFQGYTHASSQWVNFFFQHLFRANKSTIRLEIFAVSLIYILSTNRIANDRQTTRESVCASGLNRESIVEYIYVRKKECD